MPCIYDINAVVEQVLGAVSTNDGIEVHVSVPSLFGRFCS